MERLRDEFFRAVTDKERVAHQKRASCYQSRVSVGGEAKVDDTEFLAEQTRLLHGQLQMLWQNFEKLIAGEKDSRKEQMTLLLVDKTMARLTPVCPVGVQRSDLAHAFTRTMRELRQKGGHQGLPGLQTSCETPGPCGADGKGSQTCIYTLTHMHISLHVCVCTYMYIYTYDIKY